MLAVAVINKHLSESEIMSRSSGESWDCYSYSHSRTEIYKHREIKRNRKHVKKYVNYTTIQNNIENKKCAQICIQQYIQHYTL